MESKTGVIIIEGHVQGLANTRALGREGIPVYVVDVTNCVARYSRYCRKFFTCPAFESDALADFLLELAEKEQLQDWVLMPSNDHAVYTISRNKERLEKFYKFTIQDVSVIERIYDKSRLLKLAQECGVPIPKTDYFTDTRPKTKLQFPVLTKGREGLTFYKKTGKKAFLAQNPTELQSQLTGIEQKIVLEKTFTQELIPFDGTNKTVSFTAFCVNGVIKTFWMGVKLREHPIQFGTATLAESTFIKPCLEHSTALLKQLQYTGVCEIEYLKDPRDEQYRLIEMNPRTWLWVGLAVACGVNYPHYLYNYLQDIDIDYPDEYPKKVKWYNPYTDLVFGVQAIVRKKNTIKHFFEQLRGQKTNALLNLDDAFPFFAYGILLIGMLRKR